MSRRGLFQVIHGIGEAARGTINAAADKLGDKQVCFAARSGGPC